MSTNFSQLLILFAPIALLGLMLSFGKGKIVDALVNQRTIYFVLISWTLVGFLFVWDNSMRYGCIGGHGWVMGTENMVYSGLSILLLSVGFFSPGKTGLAILCVELGFWLYKLMIIKGGYVVGLSGSADEVVVLFDAVALTLRLCLIQSRYDFGLSRKVYVIPISFLIMTLKHFFWI